MQGLRHEPPVKAPEDHAREQHRKAAWLRQHRQPVGGTVGEIYLRSRGIICPLPATLGYLAPTKPGHHPALIACFDPPEEVEPGRLVTTPHIEAVHLTFLKPDGSGKANVSPNKIMVGGSLGLPIVLAPLNDLFGLAVCEGVENGLTIFQATGLGVWCAGSALAEGLYARCKRPGGFLHGEIEIIIEGLP
jgi:hypothetical protein